MGEKKTKEQMSKKERRKTISKKKRYG